VCAASIVLRMYRRLSSAPESIGVGGSCFGRFGEALMGVLYTIKYDKTVSCFHTRL
jgi:hypothetical protein